MKLVLAVSGASGSIYADRAMRFFAGPGRDAGIEVDVVFTRTARLVWSHEIGTDPASYGLKMWSPSDLTPPFASGSARYAGMLVMPCSAGCMGRIANGLSMDLVGRAADVMLKERRSLVVVLRETPLSLIHVRNMEQLLLAGATVLPAVPSFYSKPTTVEQVVDTVVARALDRLGVEHELVERWSGLGGHDVA